MNNVFYKDLYKTSIVNKAKKDLGLNHVMEVPAIKKICLNIGFGKDSANKERIQAIHDDLMLIACQKPVFCKAKKSIAGFNIREGVNIAIAVTLRGNAMYHFLARFVESALPKVKDFRGLPLKGFDGNGNYTYGIRQHSIFPEVEKSNLYNLGMSITFNTSAKNDEHCKYLLGCFNIPFVKKVGG